MAQNWLVRHVRAKGLRTASEIERSLRKYIFPFWGSRVFVSIGRGDISKLLDHVEDNHGPRQADAVLAVLSSIMHWHATRVDGYNPPVVRGMRRTSTEDQPARASSTTPSLGWCGERPRRTASLVPSSGWRS